MASRIKSITVQNLKAIAALTADFNGCTAIITGGNNKGKSTFLKSLQERLRGNKPELIVKQGESDGFSEIELTTGEKFLWQFDGKKEKVTFISERNIKSSITKDLSTYYFPAVFDVDDFLNSTPAKQKVVLQKLTGIDFTEIDILYKEAYENRTFANKKLVEAKAKLVFYDPKMAIELLPTKDLEAKIAGVDAHNATYQMKAASLKEKEQNEKDNDAEIENYKQKIIALQEKNTKLNSEIFGLEDWLENDVNKEIDPSKVDAIKQSLKIVVDQNNAINENLKAKELQDLYDKAELEASATDKEVKRIEAEKLDVIKNASMPDGFGFGEDGITYNGFAFNKEQLSSSGIYIAALKLAALGLGEVKTLYFDASFLDKNSLADIEKWANENDLQLLIERPDFEGGEIEYQIIQQ
jgi:hypothetical protein